jgi:hypothetical protein
MSTELATTTGVNPMALLQQGIDKGMDVEGMKGLFDLVREYNRDRAAEAWAAAVKKFQSKMPPVKKKKGVPDKAGNTKYTYAPYEDILEIAQPILDECGIVVTYSVDFVDKLMKTTCNVRVGTHVEPTTVPLMVPEILHANAAQNANGAITYGKRIAFNAALGIRIEGEDRDGKMDIPEPLNEQQLQRIRNTLERRKAIGIPSKFKDFADYELSFLKWLGVGDNGGWEDLPQSQFKKAIDELDSQIAKAKAK